MCYKMLRFAAFALRPASGALLLRRADSSLAATQQQDWATARTFEEIPGPKPMPIIGNAWRFIPGIGELAGLSHHEFQRALYRDYGPIVRVAGLPLRSDLIFLFEPDDIQKMFRNDGAWPIRDSVPSIYHYRTVTRSAWFKDVGGAIISQGEEWQRFRSKVNQPMMQHRSAKLYTNVINEVASDFIHRMHAMRDGEQELPADFQNELHKWALESIAAVALETRLGCLAPGLQPDSEPQRMIDAANSIFEGIHLFLMKPYLWKYVSTPSWRQFVRDLDLFQGVAWKYTTRAMKRLKERTEESDHELSILERLLVKENSPTLGATVASDMLIGGIHTTASAMATLLYHLSRYPEQQDALFQELRQVWPNDTEPLVAADKLVQLKYLKAFIKESMRVSPIVVSNNRLLSKDLVLSGYQVPKGTDVMTGQLLLSNLEEHVPQAGRFLPERWLKARDGGDGEDKTHPFVSLPFGFGARMCLGRRFAELELEILTAKIARKYQVEYRHGDMQFNSTNRPFHSPSSPLRFRLIPRE